MQHREPNITGSRIDGAQVIGAVNRKIELGVISLRDSIFLGTDIYQLLSEASIHFSPIGASAFGLGIAVPATYLASRPTSNLFDMQVRKDDKERASLVFSNAGWSETSVQEYFSITFVLDRKAHTIPTVGDQKLFVKGSFYATMLFLPTDYYTSEEGKVKVIHMEEPQSLGETVAHKLLRGAKRDMRDMAQIALLNNLEHLLGHSGVNLIRGVLNGNAAARSKLSESVKRILNELEQNLGAGFDERMIRENGRMLAGLLRLT